MVTDVEDRRAALAEVLQQLRINDMEPAILAHELPVLAEYIRVGTVPAADRIYSYPDGTLTANGRPPPADPNVWPEPILVEDERTP